MTFAQEELRKAKIGYDAACRRWFAARDIGGLVQEEDEHERAAGVRWRAVDAAGRSALSAFQLAKANLDHCAERVQRELGDDTCQQCEAIPTPARERTRLESIPDRRLPPESDDAVSP